MAAVSIVESLLSKKQPNLMDMEEDKLKITLLCLSSIIGKVHTDPHELHHKKFPWPENFYDDKIEHQISQNDIMNSDLNEESKKKCM